MPVFYLVAPQVWAWRQRPGAANQRTRRKLFCLFPFEEPWFRERHVDAYYIGHPLAANGEAPLHAARSFSSGMGCDPDYETIALLPGSRAGEAGRHMPDVLDAVELLRRQFAFRSVLATPKGFIERERLRNFSGTHMTRSPSK